MSAWCHTKCRVLLRSPAFGVTAREKAFVGLIQWHACSLVVNQFNNCMSQGHTGCTAGGYGLLSWRVQHKCTGTRGQDVYLQDWEEYQNTPWEQKKKQRKVRNRRRKAGAFSTTFCKYFVGRWLEMCSFLTNLPPKVVQIWLTGWFCYMISVVVGQTSTKVYIFGNCD